MNLEYLTRVVRSIPDGMGGDITYYTNLYTFLDRQIAVVGRTEDKMFPIYDWYAIEIDPRTGSQILYDQYSIATTGDTPGEPVGLIDDTFNPFSGVISKVSLVVETSPGDEVTV